MNRMKALLTYKIKLNQEFPLFEYQTSSINIQKEQKTYIHENTTLISYISDKFCRKYLHFVGPIINNYKIIFLYEPT